jgi:hypothetical protein
MILNRRISTDAFLKPSLWASVIRSLYSLFNLSFSISLIYDFSWFCCFLFLEGLYYFRSCRKIVIFNNYCWILFDLVGDFSIAWMFLMIFLKRGCYLIDLLNNSPYTLLLKLLLCFFGILFLQSLWRNKRMAKLHR